MSQAVSDRTRLHLFESKNRNGWILMKQLMGGIVELNYVGCSNLTAVIPAFIFFAWDFVRTVNDVSLTASRNRNS